MSTTVPYRIPQRAQNEPALIQPGVFLEVDDCIVIRTTNYNTNSPPKFYVTYRIMLPNGVHPPAASVEVQTPSPGASLDIPVQNLGPCYLESIYIGDIAGTIQYGDVKVECFAQKFAGNDDTKIFRELLIGYLSNDNPLRFPDVQQSAISRNTAGRFIVESLAPAHPSVIRTMDGNALYRILYLEVLLVSDANAGNRLLYISYTRPGISPIEYFAVASKIVQPASQSWYYLVGPVQDTAGSVALNNEVSLHCGPVYIQGGDQLKVLNTGVDGAGDSITVNLAYEKLLI